MKKDSKGRELITIEVTSNFCCSWCLNNNVNYYDDLGTKYAECQECGNLYSWDDNFHEWRLEETGENWEQEEEEE